MDEELGESDPVHFIFLDFLFLNEPLVMNVRGLIPAKSSVDAAFMIVGHGKLHTMCAFATSAEFLYIWLCDKEGVTYHLYQYISVIYRTTIYIIPHTDTKLSLLTCNERLCYSQNVGSEKICGDNLKQHEFLY